MAKVAICLSVVLFATAITAAKVEPRSSTCDPDPKLGCYSNDPPFDRLLVPLPQSSTEIGTKFRLFVRGGVGYDYLDYNSPSSISISAFNGNIDTKIICHGFLNDGDTRWMHDMKDAFLAKGNFNVIIVDWGGDELLTGSQTGYLTASANTRVVGDQIGELIKALPTARSRVHIIGHSLGSHVAGYAGVRASGLGRISGLDPADPNFQGQANAVKLDKSDALFVDVIHTDADTFTLADGFGTSDRSGHVDFWPNGGESQPGCSLIKKATIKGEQLAKDVMVHKQTRGLIGCDHNRVPALFTESITSSCQFLGYPCSSYDDFQNGKCMSCNGQCASMGYNAILYKNVYFSKQLYLNTNSGSKYCTNNYMVKVKTGDVSYAGTGANVYIRIYGTSGISYDTKLSGGFERNDEDVTIINSNTYLGNIYQIAIWHDDSGALSGWYLQSVVVQGAGSSSYLFCYRGWLEDSPNTKYLTPVSSC